MYGRISASTNARALCWTRRFSSVRARSTMRHATRLGARPLADPILRRWTNPSPFLEAVRAAVPRRRKGLGAAHVAVPGGLGPVGSGWHILQWSARRRSTASRSCTPTAPRRCASISPRRSPERFKIVTNGVTPRRSSGWPTPGLAELITEGIGEVGSELERLPGSSRGRRSGFPGPFAAIKTSNKGRLAAYWNPRRLVMTRPRCTT